MQLLTLLCCRKKVTEDSDPRSGVIWAWRHISGKKRNNDYIAPFEADMSSHYPPVGWALNTNN